jgi:NADPH:quinone reductase-like Zn-dependent oxidoreductase
VKKPTKEVLSELEHALALASEGKLTAVIDREVGLEEVPDAHRYAETGRKRGNLVVKVAGEEG